MPLTACPDCGSSVSTAAKSCPKCGHPIALVTPLQAEVAKNIKGGAQGCGFCILGLLFPLMGAVVLGILAWTGLLDWVAGNPALAVMVFVALVVVGVIGWKNRARLRGL